MSTGRKKHAHPPLKPPRTIWKKWCDKGQWFKEKIREELNDEGKVIDGRKYSFHHTKGWRSIAVTE